MLLSSFAINITKHLTLSVTWPFDSSPVHYYKWSIATMRLFATNMEIWSLKRWTDTRTDGWTDGRSGDFILCSMPLHCIGQTKNSVTWSFRAISYSG